MDEAMDMDEAILDVSAMDAARSSRDRAITLIFGNDSGADGDVVTAVPEALTFYLFDICSGRNLASLEASLAQGADPAAADLIRFFRLKEHTLRFDLTSGLAEEARNTAAEQRKMAEYVAEKNEEIVRNCRIALSRDLYPRIAREYPLSGAARRVVMSLLELEGTSIMSAPCTFLGSSSTLRSLERTESILLRSIVLCESYNVSLYRDARGRTRRAADKLAQMQTNFIELVTFKFAQDAVVQLMHQVSHGEDVDVMEELEVLRTGANHSLLDLNNVASECPVEEAQQLPFLIMKSCEVLHILQGSIVNYSKRRIHDEIAKLREQWRATGHDPPSAVFCNGTWNRAAPGRGSFGSAWQRAGHRRATNRNLARRAKQIRWHLKKQRLGQENAVTSNCLSSVNISTKRISEIRSTKQALLLTTLLSHERINTRGPPQSLFPALSKRSTVETQTLQGRKLRCASRSHGQLRASDIRDVGAVCVCPQPGAGIGGCVSLCAFASRRLLVPY